MQALTQGHSSHRPHASMGHAPNPLHHRPMPSLHPLSSRPAPRPQLREEDMCPVCHHGLPPKGPDGSEVAREAHVNSCIEQAFSSGPGSSHTAPSVATRTGEAAGGTTPTHGLAARPIPIAHHDSARSNDIPSGSFQQRRAGMLVYPASEKDCVGKDGEGQECVICFEEFAVGDELGRLECWCRFHAVGLLISTETTDRGLTKMANRLAYVNGGIPVLRVLVLVQYINMVIEVQRPRRSIRELYISSAHTVRWVFFGSNEIGVFDTRSLHDTRLISVEVHGITLLARLGISSLPPNCIPWARFLQKKMKILLSIEWIHGGHSEQVLACK